jgi:hypothetical protein
MATVLKLLKGLLLLSLVCGLPLQNLHAAVMPVCNQDRNQQTSVQHQHQHPRDGNASEHQHPKNQQTDDLQTDHQHAEHQHDDGSSDTKLTCDGCNLCNACSAPAVASVSINVSIDTVEAPLPVATSHISLFDPEQLHRPPLAVLS